MKKLYTIILISIFSVNLSAQDTFSIVAIDTVTGEVGSAGASCVYIAGQGVMILSDVHPGVGVIHTQAWYQSGNQAYARNLMNLGLSPQQIIDSLVANDVQNNPTLRQYGIVDFRDGVVRSAAYTGINCDDYKNHITGPNYAIQGNILLGQQILDSMEARFLAADGELACRLMEALQGANVEGADTRCMGDGTSSIGSFLRVARPGDPVNDLYLQFNIIRADDGVDPIDSMQVLIDQWGGCLSTGLAGNPTEDLLRVYPNPATTFVSFQLNENLNINGMKLVIFDAQGRQVKETIADKSGIFTWNLENSAPGLYIYHLYDQHGPVGSGKFIVGGL